MTPLKDIKVRPGLTQLGRIRLGYFDEKKNMPRSYDHFALHDAPTLIPFYGETPTEISCMAPYDDVDRVCSAFYELWRKRGLVCRGDGEHILKLIDTRTDDPLVEQGVAKRAFDAYEEGAEVPCPGTAREHPWCEACRPVVRFHIVVRDPDDAQGRPIADQFGYYTVTTSSIFNYRQIYARLSWIAEQIEDVPIRLQAIPLILRRVQRELTYRKDDGTQAKREFDLLDLEIDPIWVAWQEAMRVSMFQPIERPELPERVYAEGEIVDLPMDEFELPPTPKERAAYWHVVQEDFRNFGQFEKYLRETIDGDFDTLDWEIIWFHIHSEDYKKNVK